MTYERRASRGFLGEAYLRAQRWAEAIATYRAAIGISTEVGADTTTYLMGTAFAQANVGDLADADQNASMAVSQREAAVAAAKDPDARGVSVVELRSAYALAAQIKRLLGDSAGALALERKAAALDIPK